MTKSRIRTTRFMMHSKRNTSRNPRLKRMREPLKCVHYPEKHPHFDGLNSARMSDQIVVALDKRLRRSPREEGIEVRTYRDSVRQEVVVMCHRRPVSLPLRRAHPARSSPVIMCIK